MAGGEETIAAVESYLAVRRAAGFTLGNTDYNTAHFFRDGVPNPRRRPPSRRLDTMEIVSAGRIAGPTCSAFAGEYEGVFEGLFF